MPSFAMICSCTMLLSCSKHCFLMINSWLVVIFTKSVTSNLLHFCHACLSLQLSKLAIAQCSYFVKLHEWTPAMYFVAMFEYCSIIILMHLDGYLLFITDRCHICFACHFQTMHRIPVIFISISTKINSSFQVEARFNHSFPNHAYASHTASRISYHVCIMLFEHCTWLIVFLLLVCLVWVEPGD